MLQPQPLRAVSQSAYRMMFSRAPDVCVALQFGSGRIVQCNERVRTVLGFAPEEVVGRSLASLAFTEDSQPARNFLHTLAAGTDLPPTRLPMRCKDGTRVDVCVSVAGVREPSGRVAFGCALLRAPRARVPSTEDPARLRSLLFALSVAEERERRRIAAGLHDELGQLLAIARFKLGQLGDAQDPMARKGLCDELAEVIDQAIRATRTTTFELSSPVLEQFGIEAAIRTLGERLQTLYGIDFRLVSDGVPVVLPESTLAVILRVIRELFFNVHKHARAHRVVAVVRRVEGEQVFEVQDDGCGLSALTARGLSPAGGFGLLSVKAQVESLGGSFAIGPCAGGGTRALVRIPQSRPPTS
jgi:PAS domain S-box-containing protein